MEKTKEIMKKVLRFMKSAVRGIAFVTLVVFLIVRCYEVLSWKDTLGDYLSSTQQLYATEENRMDVLVVGSSHAYCSFSPAILWNETGVASFNMTTSGQDKNSTVHYLIEALKTQSPKVVFVELWGLTFETHAIEGNVHRNMMGMPLSENSIALIDDYVTDEEMNTAYKLRWPIIHTRYKELDRYDFIQYDFSEYGRGVDLNFTPGLAGYPAEALQNTEAGILYKTNQAWLDELYQLSVDEGFELVFYAAPTIVSYEEQGQINAAGKYAEEHGIDFFDFNRLAEEVGIDFNTDFVDNYHLNAYGAEKLTLYLGDYLEEKYDLEDHRGDSSYQQWDDSYTRHVQVRDAYVLKQCYTYDQYINQIKSMENITCFISFEGEFMFSPLQLSYAAWMLGIDQENYQKGGTYMYKDGELTLIMDNQSKEVYIHEVTAYDSFKIQNMNLVDSSANGMSDIMFNMETVGTYPNGLNFVVYDNFRHEIIDTRGFY